MANTRRQPITVNAAEVSSAVTDFPVHIPRALLDDEACDPSGDNNAQSNGGDLRWYSDAGATRQPLEVVAFERDTTTGAGDADVELHGLAPSLSAVVDTTLYLEYNSPTTLSQPAASDTHGSQNVWNGDYELVLHMSQDPSGSAPQILDSTSNANHGTSAGSMTSGDLVDGVVGKALDFDGSNDQLTFNGSTFPSLGNEMTIEAVLKIPAAASTPVIFGQSNANNAYHFEVGTTTNNITVFEPGTNIARSVGGVWSDDSWFHAAYTRSGTGSGTHAIYSGGASVALDVDSSANFSNTTATKQIGQRGNSSQFLNGMVDEFRLSATPRSAAWIAATDSTLLTPGTFASAGTPVAVGNPWYYYAQQQVAS